MLVIIQVGLVLLTPPPGGHHQLVLQLLHQDVAMDDGDKAQHYGDYQQD